MPINLTVKNVRIIGDKTPVAASGSVGWQPPETIRQDSGESKRTAVNKPGARTLNYAQPTEDLYDQSNTSRQVAKRPSNASLWQTPSVAVKSEHDASPTPYKSVLRNTNNQSKTVLASL